MSEARPAPLAGRTAWARNLETPLRSFLRTETGSAAVLLSATVAALVWVNVDASSYERVWRHRHLDPRRRLGRSRRTCAVLAEQRADDVLLLRRRSRGAARVRHGRAARAAPGRAAARGRRSAGWSCRSLIFLAVNAGRPSAHGWGAAMSTDTAFALGMLALVGPRFPDAAARLHAHRRRSSTTSWRCCVIGTVYTEHLRVAAARWRPALFAALLLLDATAASARARLRGARRRRSWVALFKSGVDPVVDRARDGPADVRLAGGARRPRARHRPVPAVPRAADAGARALGAARARARRSRRTSGCSRLFHPWTSYVIVPLFALANAGIAVNGGLLCASLHLADHARAS